MITNTYSLIHDDFGQIEVLEINCAKIFSVPQNILECCVILSQKEIDEVKRGYSKPLRENFKDPKRSLIRIGGLVCSNYKDCASYSKTDCKTNAVKNKKPNFPLCWEYENDEDFIVRTIIMGMRENRMIIINSG